MYASKKKQNRTQSQSAALVALMLAATTAHGQITPGQVTDTLKRPVELKQPDAAPLIERQDQLQQGQNQAVAGRTIKVGKFEFNGNTVFSSQQLALLISDYLNKPITLADVYAAADRVSDFYASKGYTLASVNVPPQKISSGVVRLEVSEGVIGKVTVEGNKRHDADLIAGFLGVKSGAIYQGGDLREGMQRLNSLPGLKAKAIVKPGTEYGTTDLVIKTDEDTVDGSFFVDNYGTQAIGEVRFAANVVVNNLTGREDQLNLLALRSENDLLAYGSLGYSVPVDFRGTRLSMTFGQADFEVPGSAEGTSKTGKVALEKPLLRGQRDQVDLAVGVSRTNSEAFISGTSILASGTSITLAEVGATYNHAFDNAAVTQVAANLSSNFGKSETAAEARPVAVKAEQAGQRLRVELDAQHLQPIGSGFFALAHANGVYSPDPLSNVNQFSIGGPQSIRGYQPSEIRGDRGYFGQLTVGKNFNAGPLGVTARVFGDSGKVLCAVAAPDCTARSISSAGAGTDITYGRLSARFDYSFPLGSYLASDGEDSGRFFGALFVTF